MPKTISEKIALILGTGSFLLLIPLLFLAVIYTPLFLFSALYLFASWLSHPDYLLFLGPIFFSVFVVIFCSFGLRLLIGYIKHSRGKLKAEKINQLWIETIIYNSILFFPVFYLSLQCWLKEEYSGCRNEFSVLESSFLFPYIIVWLFLTIVLSFISLSSIEEKID